MKICICGENVIKEDFAMLCIGDTSCVCGIKVILYKWRKLWMIKKKIIKKW